MPNPLQPYQHCSQAPLQDRLDRAESAAFEAQQAFQGHLYRMPRKRALTTPEWRAFNQVRNDYLVKSAARDRAFVAQQMCQTVYTIPPRPRLDPPKLPNSP